MNKTKKTTQKEINNKRPSLNTGDKLTALGLIVAALGILILFLTGWVKQALPTGTLLLAPAAGLVVFGRWRWTLIFSLILSLFIFVMAFIAPGLFERLNNPAAVSGFIGTWVQMLGLVIAIISGIFVNKAKSRE